MGTVIRRLAWSNIRKRKSATTTLFILIAMTVLFLNIGLTVSLKLGTFQEQKMAELHAPDLLSYYSDSGHVEDFQAVVDHYPATDYWEDEQALLLPESKIRYGDSEMLAGFLFLNAETPRQFSPLPESVTLPQPDAQDYVYLPLMFHLSGGYEVGEVFTFADGDQDLSFYIAGFFEEPLIGTFNNGAVKVFAGASAYAALEKALGQAAQYHFLSVSLKDSGEAEKLNQVLTEQIAAWDIGENYVVMDAQSGMFGNRFFINLIAAILVVFSLLLVLIALIVIRFQLMEQIEDYIVNIGILKANGYTSGQIRGAILLQFLLVSFAAGLAGLGVSGVLMPLAGNMISASMGLLWPNAFDIAGALFSLLAVVMLVLAVAGLASRHISAITPVNALQAGLQSHNFKPNRIPLSSSRLGLQPALGLKVLLRQTKQNVMLLVIVAGLTFSSVFCAIMNFNMSGDNSEIINLVGLERSTASLTSNQQGISAQQYKELAAMEGVRKLTMLDQMSATIQDYAVLMKVSDDFSQLETKTVFRGREPVYDNEISLSGIIASRTGTSIGEEVAVTVNGVTESYLITGLSQQISQLGMVASMTDEGFSRLMPDYMRRSVNVYLDKAVEPDAFARQVEERFPGQLHFLNIEKWLKGTLSTFTSAISAITWIITAVTMVVVSLILYLVIKTLILKRKREFGILKGMGFTSLQLMTQIVFSLLPVIIAGVLAGSVLGYFYSDELFVLLLSSLGIYNVEFTVNLPQVLILCLAIVAVAYGVSMLVSLRIRRISVYGLISE